jgi:hypothetical protein
MKPAWYVKTFTHPEMLERWLNELGEQSELAWLDIEVVSLAVQPDETILIIVRTVKV